MFPYKTCPLGLWQKETQARLKPVSSVSEKINKKNYNMCYML